jgi:hypothetical protein
MLTVSVSVIYIVVSHSASVLIAIVNSTVSIFPFRQARCLWYTESGIDSCYYVPRQATLYPEMLKLQSENRLSIRDVRWQIEVSARIKKFMIHYEAHHLLRTQIIRSYLMMFEPYKRNYLIFNMKLYTRIGCRLM